MILHTRLIIVQFVIELGFGEPEYLIVLQFRFDDSVWRFFVLLRLQICYQFAFFIVAATCKFDKVIDFVGECFFSGVLFCKILG